MEYTVSAIVPAYNEEKKILAVLRVLAKSVLIDEIIVVNDGSTDRTSKIVKSILQAKLINNSKNRGKGYAIARGIEKACGDVVLFVDADISGLTEELIKNLVNPLLSKKYDLAIGYRSSAIESSVGVPLSGERAYLKKDLMPHIAILEKKAYGALELYLNFVFKNKRKKIIHLKGVYSAPKHIKYSYPLATKLYLHEMYKVANEIFLRKDLFSYFKNSYLYYVHFRNRSLPEYYISSYRYLTKELF